MQSILGAQAERDEASVQTSFASVTGFVWSIPVLGFIGTVVGLSVAIGGFANVLNAVSDTSQIVEALKGVTGGLGTAFETTLEGTCRRTCYSIIYHAAATPRGRVPGRMCGILHTTHRGKTANFTL